MRCYPIESGKNVQDLWNNTQKFFEEVLSIPAEDLHPGAVVDIARVPTGGKKNAVRGKVVVTFDTIASRDIAAS